MNLEDMMLKKEKDIYEQAFDSSIWKNREKIDFLKSEMNKSGAPMK